MSAETFITDKVNRYLQAVRDFDRVQQFQIGKATDGDGFLQPFTLGQKLRIEEAATKVRDTLRDLLQ